ncbi:MAG TPA: phenylalanine--tRNA ligase subunit beta [Nanoarchaeota archaeon]|nr:phenylalanine--tRNA ligase subunit beta [Nanoarchaeota archaeon]
MASRISGDEMPVIEVDKKYLMGLCRIPEEELKEVLTMIKAPIDEEQGDIWKLEITPDRPDLLSPEGVARAVKGFLGIESEIPQYAIVDTDIVVEVEKVEARPYIACACVLGVKLNDYIIKSLMQLQEKLHETLGRKRKKVAIGLHDLDKVTPPFRYIQAHPKEIIFVPLGKSEKMSLDEILKFHEKGREYAYCLEGFEKYPVIIDKYGEVLSFPPIINGELTKVTENTKNLFIDVTGTDKNTVEKVLNIIVCSIAEIGGKIGKVKVGDKIYPDLTPESFELKVENTDRLLGLGLKEHEIAEILKRMRYSVIELKGGIIKVLVPPYRIDILHEVDLIEDVAIGYGINNISPIIPKLPTVGKKHEKEKISEKIREIMIGFGMQEIFSFILSNKEKQFSKMNIPEMQCVEIANPVTEEYTICRTWLLPCLLEFLSENTHNKYPQKIFEIGDCVLLDENCEIGAREERKLACAIAYDKANLTEIKSIVEALAKELNVSLVIKPYEHESFIPSRCGEIYINGKSVGIFGEIHPKVLENWKIEKPVIAFEINIEELFSKKLK